MNVGDLVRVRYIDPMIHRPLADAIGNMAGLFVQPWTLRWYNEVWGVLNEARWLPNEIGEVIEVLDPEEKYDVYVRFGIQSTPYVVGNPLRYVDHTVVDRSYYFARNEVELIHTDDRMAP